VAGSNDSNIALAFYYFYNLSGDHCVQGLTARAATRVTDQQPLANTCASEAKNPGPQNSPGRYLDQSKTIP
jgi:hypothetical protein